MKPLAPQTESESGRQAACSSRPQETRPKATRSQEKGYILLTLLLVVALMGIFALTVTSKIDFEIRRDQEQEMIHRGVQYSRAIRGYYKKFGRYPTRLEDLDNTNNLRYLRKHYKDPLNKNKDFRLLHFGEQGVSLAGGLVGGGIPGANPAGATTILNGSGQGNSAFGGGTAGSTLGNTGVNSSGVFAQSSGFGGNSKSSLGANSNSDASSGQTGTAPASGSDPTQASAQVAPGTAQGDTSSGSQQLVASGPIVGVASISKKETIREFNKKRRYNEWQFLYDPAFDRGGLITTPYQPLLQTLINPGLNNLQPGATGTSSPGQSAFGQSSFGQSGQSGYGTGSSPVGTTPPAPPAPNPPQQQ